MKDYYIEKRQEYLRELQGKISTRSPREMNMALVGFVILIAVALAQLT